VRQGVFAEQSMPVAAAAAGAPRATQDVAERTEALRARQDTR